MNEPLLFRSAASEPDRIGVRDIVASTGFFNPEEIDIAEELVTERLNRGDASGYYFIFADLSGTPAGYACYGPIAGTQSSFDLFWVAVRDDLRGRGIGRQLMDRSESAIRGMGGTRVYVETSSRAQYEPTRAFYCACGYSIEAVIQDFYGPEDAKCIFVKVIDS